MTSSRITVLDYTLLGLLQSESRSGYAIRQVFEHTALGNFSSSPGTIYPALKKLKKLHLVRQESQEKKAPYQITNQGKGLLIKWFTQPITKEEVAKTPHLLILRFAFMDHLVKKPLKIAFVTRFRDLVKVYLLELKSFHKQQAIHFPPAAKLAFEHGLIHYEGHLKWSNQALKTLLNTKD